MSSVLASTDFLQLVQAAAGSTPVLPSERGGHDTLKVDRPRPYFRVQFQLLHGQTPIPGRLQGRALVACFAKDALHAWKLATDLGESLALLTDKAVAPASPCLISDYRSESGWQPGADPAGGGMVYASIVFHYYP